jgi:glycosyltransferase involved in cell wall biosynthesis
MEFRSRRALPAAINKRLSYSFQSNGKEAAKPGLVRMIARLNVGGAAQQVCMLHEKLAPIFETHLIFGRLAEGENDMSYLLRSNRNVLRVPEMSREITLADMIAFWKIFKFLRRVRPAVVHTHTAKAGALGRLAAWMAGVPVIVHTYHGHVFHGYFSPLRTRLFLAIERFLGRRSTRIIAISESQLEELSSTYRIAPREKISVIHNGYELELFGRCGREEARKDLGLGPDDFAVVWAGRLVPVKDIELLGAVIRRFAENNARLRFLVVGEGTERAALAEMVKGNDNVDLLGWRQDMARIWSAADAALLTSRNEGTPTALIEAMATGVPFVATHVGGVQDIALGPLQELPHGFGFEARNGFVTARTPEALQYCLNLLASRREMARDMGMRGQSFAHERFSMSRLVSELSSLYQRLLQGKAKMELAPAGPAPEDKSNAADAV